MAEDNAPNPNDFILATYHHGGLAASSVQVAILPADRFPRAQLEQILAHRKAPTLEQIQDVLMKDNRAKIIIAAADLGEAPNAVVRILSKMNEGETSRDRLAANIIASTETGLGRR